MSNSHPEQNKLNELPEEIDGYQRRIMELGDGVVIEYSTRPVFFRHVNPGSIPNHIVEDHLLFDVVAPSVEEAVKQMQNKIEEYRNEYPN